MPNKKFVQLAKPFLEQRLGRLPNDIDWEKILRIEQERVNKLSDIGEGIGFLMADDLTYTPELLVRKKSNKEQTISNLQLIEKEINNFTDFSKEGLEKYFLEFIKGRGLSNGEVLWPLRVALTGQEKSPTPFEVAEIQGKEKVLKRIGEAIEKLS
jgi:glutamyl-tRNA synthetase